MTGELPRGWATTEFSNVVIYGKGKKPKSLSNDKKEGYIPYVNIKAFEQGIINEYADIESSKLIDENDILVVWDGARFGLTGTGVAGAAGSTLMVIKPVVCDKNFVFSFINRYYSYINSKPKGAATPHVNPDIFWNLQFPIIPLNEQKRIVTKLDAIMPQIEAVKARLDKIPLILKRYRQSVLTAAVNGRLTEKWREEHPDMEIKEILLNDIIISKPRNGYSPTPVKYKTDVKSLTLTATTSGLFDGSCFKFIDEVIPKDSHLWLEKDDILIQRSNSINYVGISAIYTGNSFEYIYPDLMMKVKANKEIVLPSFLVLSLQSFQTLDYFRSNANGTAGSMPKINRTVVMNTPIPLPPLEEQKEIVKQVDKLFALADKVEAHYSEVKARVDKLSQSVLAKAFRGELVPQDPEDEPAEKLLERIMEEKAKMEAELKAVKKATKRSKK